MEILLAILIILIWLLLRSPADKGKRGERRVGRAIARGLNPDEYVVFHDLVLETPDGTVWPLDSRTPCLSPGFFQFP